MSKIEDELFNLKFAVKQMRKEAQKYDKQILTEKGKMKKAMVNNRLDVAQTHATSAIMLKTSSAQFLRMASKVEAVSIKLSAAVKMRNVTASMAQITKIMSKALKTMNLEKIQMTMDKFEETFEDTDVMGDVVLKTMDSNTQLSTPQEEVFELMSQVADENELDLKDHIPKPTQLHRQERTQEDDIYERLMSLKSPPTSTGT